MFARSCQVRQASLWVQPFTSISQCGGLSLSNTSFTPARPAPVALLGTDFVHCLSPLLFSSPRDPASTLSGIAVLGQPSASAGQAINAMQSFATHPALVAATVSSAASPTVNIVKPGMAMVLSSALLPVTAKLVAKISSGQFVAMKEFLADIMSLCHQLESFPTHQHLFLGMTKPRLREIDSPLTWVSCFLACSQDDRPGHSQPADIRPPRDQRSERHSVIVDQAGSSTTGYFASMQH